MARAPQMTHLSGMQNLPTAPLEMTRDEAVRRLRYHLLKMTDDEHSICQVAAKTGIFCKGFSRWSDKELRDHFGNLVRHRPGMNRWQLEALANEWELARQTVDHVRIACDAQSLEHDT